MVDGAKLFFSISKICLLILVLIIACFFIVFPTSNSNSYREPVTDSFDDIVKKLNKVNSQSTETPSAPGAAKEINNEAQDPAAETAKKTNKGTQDTAPAEPVKIEK